MREEGKVDRGQSLTEPIARIETQIGKNDDERP
jgi:hypothetical protein